MNNTMARVDYYEANRNKIKEVIEQDAIQWWASRGWKLVRKPFDRKLNTVPIDSPDAMTMIEKEVERMKDESDEEYNARCRNMIKDHTDEPQYLASPCHQDRIVVKRQNPDGSITTLYDNNSNGNSGESW